LDQPLLESVSASTIGHGAAYLRTQLGTLGIGGGEFC
jgi:hypothetical protein